MTKPTLLILAAGMGSRYGGLKQIDPVGPNGETIMDYSIFDALRAGFGKIVFIIRCDLEQAFKETLGARFEKQAPVEYVFQELDKLPSGFSVPPGRQKPWGTGHAILMAAEVVQEPFAVINADDFYGARSFQALAAHLSADVSHYAMVGFRLRNTLSEHGSVARGVCCMSDQGFLESVTEMTGIEKNDAGAKYTDAGGKTHALTGDEIISMNLWGFTPSLFGHLQEQFRDFLKKRGAEEKSEFYIPSVVNTLIQTHQEQCRVIKTPDSWLGVTYRADRQRVSDGIRQLVVRGDYPAKLWS